MTASAEAVEYTTDYGETEDESMKYGIAGFSTRFSAAIFLLVVVATALSSLAQQQMGRGGHTLDANLQLGSGGYNRAVRPSGYMAGRRYTIGSSKPLYVVGPRGGMHYSPNNAFFPRSQYRATGYPGRFSDTATTGASLSRFRYWNR